MVERAPRDRRDWVTGNLLSAADPADFCRLGPQLSPEGVVNPNHVVKIFLSKSSRSLSLFFYQISL